MAQDHKIGEALIVIESRENSSKARNATGRENECDDAERDEEKRIQILSTLIPSSQARIHLSHDFKGSQTPPSHRSDKAMRGGNGGVDGKV